MLQFRRVPKIDYLGHEGTYYSLMMSIGLTFGTISTLFGLNRQIIDRTQYSHVEATVIGSALVPIMIANALFTQTHLLPSSPTRSEATATVPGAADSAR